jgi:hypothetical protein
MTLAEYYRAFQRCLPAPVEGDLPRDVAACVAAGHAVGLSPEQLREFLARRAEISSVTVALVNWLTSPEVIERILSARQEGCVYPKEVLAAAFSPAEVRDEFHAAVFSKLQGDAEPIYGH